MSDDALPEADRLDGAPHPRETVRLFGQDVAEATFLGALNAGRLPHAWLSDGAKGRRQGQLRLARGALPDRDPAGGGRRALRPAARRNARHRSRTPRRPASPRPVGARPPAAAAGLGPGAQTPEGATDGGRGARAQGVFRPVRRRRAARGDRRLRRRDEPIGGQRAPEGTGGAAEEHGDVPRLAPALGPLPTIRSRCRTLRFDPLSPDDLAAALDQAGLALPGDASAEAIASLAEGSVGAAVQLVEQDGVALYRDLVQPDVRPAGHGPVNGAETLGRRRRARGGDALRPDAGAARPAAGAAGATRRDRARRPRPSCRARTPSYPACPRPAAASRLGGACRRPHRRARRGKAVNLDPAALIFDMFLDLDRTAERLAVPAA
jgi:DNA polymerase-3 subunit delta'